MRIVFLVAGAAVLRQRICQLPGVAGGAFQLLVPRRQVEVGSRTMIEPGRRPAARVMAAAAVIAESAFMNVIAGVTTLATAAAKVVMTFRAVAVTAGQVVMSVCQSETRDLEVVKSNADPVGGDVTTAAFRSVVAVVYVICLVTGDTCGANVGKVCRFMTILTSGLGMCAGKSKDRIRMIKMGLLPVFADMARGAVLSEAAIVHVISPVTANALRRRIAARRIRFVTADTVEVCMCAL